MEAVMPKRILIVDDSRLMRSMISEILKTAGYEIAGEASTGIEAIEKYRELKPDLMTLDIVMPEMKGLDALKEIIGFDPGANIVIVSSLGQKLLTDDAIASGAKDFVAKPFKNDDLLRIVKRVVGEG
jgi:two-component system chemotaxis response regulator CheY